MYRDIVEIRQFYQSPLGRVTVQTIIKILRALWPEVSPQDRLAGIGYALPYLNHFDQPHSIAVMPATQGALRWPEHGPCRTVVSEDAVIPLLDHSVDRALVIHALENSEALPDMMRELWRVLTPNGRIILIVPNRAGLWTRSDKTPFGHGRPYSMKQLRALLHNQQFVIERQVRGLYGMPTEKHFMHLIAPLLEAIGRRFLPKLGGILVVEASKQLYNVTPLWVAERASERAPAPQAIWPEPVPTS